MSREIKKPEMIMEKDLKDDAGPIMIDVSPKGAEEVVAQKKLEPLIPPNAAIPQVAPVSKLITFSTWFQKRSGHNPKLKLSYKEAIEAHCKAIGILSHATEEEFDAALAHFGL